MQHFKLPSKLSPEEQKVLGDALDTVYHELQIADVALRLEGQSDAIKELTELAKWFRSFRNSLSLAEDGGAKFWAEADKAAQQVRAKAESLEEILRKALAELNPPGPEPPETSGFIATRTAFFKWWKT